jgi:hypothetical protein
MEASGMDVAFMVGPCWNVLRLLGIFFNVVCVVVFIIMFSIEVVVLRGMDRFRVRGRDGHMVESGVQGWIFFDFILSLLVSRRGKRWRRSRELLLLLLEVGLMEDLPMHNHWHWMVVVLPPDSLLEVFIQSSEVASKANLLLLFLLLLILQSLFLHSLL